LLGSLLKDFNSDCNNYNTLKLKSFLITLAKQNNNGTEENKNRLKEKPLLLAVFLLISSI